MVEQITIAYTPEYLEWTGSVSSPSRAKHAVEQIVDEAVDGVRMLTPTLDWDALAETLAAVHDPAYVADVRRGAAGEHGHNVRQGEVAALMFQGTVDLVGAIEADGFAARVYFNPQGAKHHAQYDHASGFCVFADMAWAAQHFASQGRRVAYLDWDIHHGDGTENLTRESGDILTASIHEWGIFPGTGRDSQPEDHVYNWALPTGAGDLELGEAMTEAIGHVEAFEPDVLLLACGADGLAMDPLSSARYTIEGISCAARTFGDLAARLGAPVLIGGAGGYLPETETPRAWAITVAEIQRALTTMDVGHPAPAAH